MDVVTAGHSHTCTHRLRIGRACGQRRQPRPAPECAPMQPGDLLAAEVAVRSKSPAYQRRDGKVKRREVRRGALLGVSFIIADVEL